MAFEAWVAEVLQKLVAAIPSEMADAEVQVGPELDGDESDRAAWAAAGDDAPTATESTETTESIDDDDMVEWRHAPHVLAMSATPIPRTLAMCKHGEMALSSIDEKPAGRLPIYTKLLIGPDGIDDAHRAMVEEVQIGGQCYVITPLVNASTADSFERFKSAEVEHKRLVEKFPQYNGIVVAEFGRTIMDSG